MNPLTLSKEERLEQLHEARELLEQVIELVRTAVQGTQQGVYANAYIIPHLESWVDQEHSSIEKLNEAFEEQGECEECGALCDADLCVCDNCYRAALAEVERAEQEPEPRLMRQCPGCSQPTESDLMEDGLCPACYEDAVAE